MSDYEELKKLYEKERPFIEELICFVFDSFNDKVHELGDKLSAKALLVGYLDMATHLYSKANSIMLKSINNNKEKEEYLKITWNEFVRRSERYTKLYLKEYEEELPNKPSH